MAWAGRRACHTGKCCPHFLRAKQSRLDEEVILHLEQSSHPSASCNMGLSCPAFQRLERDAASATDAAHCLVYSHPPRERFGSVVAGSPTQDHICCIQLDEWDSTEEMQRKLFEEALLNGIPLGPRFLSELNRKMDHPRHHELNDPLNAAEMAAVLAFSKTEIMDSISQAIAVNEYFNRWAFFHNLLGSAIKKLHAADPPRCDFYYRAVVESQSEHAHAIGRSVKDPKGVAVQTSETHQRTFPLLSMTAKREVAEWFGAQSTLVVVEGAALRRTRADGAPNYAADISWISSFPEEGEVAVWSAQFTVQPPRKTHSAERGSYWLQQFQ